MPEPRLVARYAGEVHHCVRGVQRGLKVVESPRLLRGVRLRPRGRMAARNSGVKFKIAP